MMMMVVIIVVVRLELRTRVSNCRSQLGGRSQRTGILVGVVILLVVVVTADRGGVDGGSGRGDCGLACV